MQELGEPYIVTEQLVCKAWCLGNQHRFNCSVYACKVVSFLSAVAKTTFLHCHLCSLRYTSKKQLRHAVL
jgi:hypothetical protein